MEFEIIISNLIADWNRKNIFLLKYNIRNHIVLRQNRYIRENILLD
ncbi:MAG: hypothetical protein ACI8XB_001335 [Patiriisocius sp.]|jgi:hypothetical protein